MKFALALGAIVVGLIAMGCGDDDSGCAPGATRACACTDGRPGAQTCGATGVFGICMCEGSDAGPDDDAGEPTPDAGPAIDAGETLPDAGESPDAGGACTSGAERPCGSEASLMMIGECRPGTQLCIDEAWSSCIGERGPEEEVCNTQDDDCDSTVDEGVVRPYYRDADGDGYGSPDEFVAACSAPSGYADSGTDCDDSRAGINPSSPEVCDGVDNDCNGIIDEGLGIAFYRDTDGDGFGSSDTMMTACSPPAGYATTGGDCDDANAAVHPASVEICNAMDDDCDGAVDETPCTCPEGAMRTCGFTDVGACSYGTQTCVASVWAMCVGSIEPVTEICGNGADDDCDAMTDEMCP